MQFSDVSKCPKGKQQHVIDFAHKCPKGDKQMSCRFVMRCEAESLAGNDQLQGALAFHSLSLSDKMVQWQLTGCMLTPSASAPAREQQDVTDFVELFESGSRIVV